jgi:hypothetical protein
MDLGLLDRFQHASCAVLVDLGPHRLRDTKSVNEYVNRLFMCFMD